MSDAEIIQALKENKTAAAVKKLYAYFPAVRQMILKNSGTKQDAEDIYQEALIIFCRKAVDQNFKLTSSINTFLFSISRLQWMNELRKRKISVDENSANEKVDDAISLSHYIEEEEQFKKAEAAVMQLGEKCRELLQLFYFSKMDFKQIASKLGFSNEKVAKNQKYRCLEKARENFLKMSR